MEGAPAATPARLAVFDLDGTLTRGDTYVQFVGAALRAWPARRWRLPGVIGPALAYVTGLSDRGGLKGALLHTLLGGLPRSGLDALADRFAQHIVANGLHAEARPTIESHRAAGDHLVLLSASPDLYVPRIARLLGFDECLCSPVRWNGDRLDGRLAAANVRGPEKARLFRGLADQHPERLSIAYGNAGSDIEHLRLATTAVYVNAAAGERRSLSDRGIVCVDWH